MKRLWTPAWITRHVITVVLVTAFLTLGWWQISRAAAGNTLSWAYAFEWPIFAGFVVFLWFREARHAVRGSDRSGQPGDSGAGPSTEIGGTTAPGDDTAGPGIRRPVRARRGPVVPVEDDPVLDAYNEYLSWLNTNPGARPGDYPGGSRQEGTRQP